MENDNRGYFRCGASPFYKPNNKTGVLKPVLFIYFLLFFFTFLPNKLLAVSYVWNGATSAAWATPTNWTPNGNPGSAAGDIVSIPEVGTQPTLSITPANALASLTFTGASATLTITAVTLTVTGAVTLNSIAGTNTACTITGTGSLTCGSFIVGTAITPTANRTTILTSTIADLNVTDNITIVSSSRTTPNIRTNNSTLTHTSGVVTTAGITTNNAGGTGGGGPTSSYVMGSTSPTLNLTGATPFTIGAGGTNTITLTGTGATVDYQYSAGNTTFLAAPAGLLAYTNLIISGGAGNVKTLGGATTISGTLSISDASTLTVPDFPLTVTGTTTVGEGTSGTLTINNATGTKTFTGIVTINSGGSLIETAAATLSFGNDVIITGTLTEFGAAVVGIAGSLTNNGTYTASTGVHTFSGAAKILSGSTTTTIASVTVSGTYTNSGTLTVGTALAGAGSLTNTGTLNIGGTSSITVLTVSAAGNTVNYTGLGAQTVKAVSYQNIILSGSGAKTMLTGTSVLGELSIAPSGSATASVGAGLNLIVNSLLLAGANQVSGTYGSTSSAATFQNDTYFSATTGILSVNLPIVSTATGGDWNTGSTWVGGIVPTATQSAVIATTGVGEVITSGTVICANLTVNSGAILTVNRNFTMNGTASITGTINFGSTNPTIRVMTFNASVTLNSGAIWDETDGGSNTVLHTYFFANSIINNATTFTALTGLHTFSGTGMMLSGATTTSIANVEVTGTYTNTGTLTVGTALSGTGTLINGDGTTGTLNIGGTATITGLTASAANNTIDYTGGAQTIYIPSSGVYHHLIFSGSAAKTLDVGITTINGNFTMAGTATTTGLIGLTIGGDVTLGSGTTFTAGAFTHNVAGDWINNGGTFTNTGSTINFNGSGAQTIISGGSSFNNFTITNTGGTCTASINDITVAGTFTTNASTTLDMGTNALIVTTVAHSGTLKTQNVSATPITAAKTWGGLVEYNSASNQTIINGTYNDLMISNAGVKTILTATTVNCQTITFNDAATLDILGTGLFNVLG